MRKLGAILVALLLALTFVRVAFAAPFPDLPSDHWAYDAVARLAAKGILEGYPDGLYRGDRAASRYEMAMAVARVVARIEELANSLPDFSMFVTKDDLEIVKRLLYEFRDELDALGVRVSNLEEQVAKLQKRLERLEKVTFDGEYRFAYSDAFVKAEGGTLPGTPFVDTMLAATTYKFYDINAEYEPFTGDFYESPLYYFANGYLIDTHENSMDLATLRVRAKINGWKAILKMRSKVLTASSAFDNLYGPQFGFYGNAEVDFGLAQPNYFYFESIKLCNPNGNLKFELGAFRPTYTPSYVFAGIPREYYWRDEYGYWNPLWGWKIVGGREGTGVLGNFEYELLYGKVGNLNGYWRPGTESQVLVSGTAKFNFQKGYLLLNFSRMYDTRTSAGIVPAQDMTTWAIELGYKFKKVNLGIAYATSTYYYNKTLADNALIAHPFFAGYPGLTNKIDSNNSFFNIYLDGNFGAEKKGYWKLEYVSTDLFYEPYVLVAGYAWLLPMNVRKYVHNYDGWRVYLSYKFNPSFRGWLSYESYNEKRIWLAGDAKDTMQIWNLGFEYKFNKKFDMLVNYFSFNYKDKTTAVTNDNQSNWLDVAFRYHQSEKTNWLLGYTNYNGNTPTYFYNSTNENNYHIYLGVNYQANEDTRFFATYRFLKFNDKTAANNDASGNQLWMGVSFKFGQK